MSGKRTKLLSMSVIVPFVDTLTPLPALPISTGVLKIILVIPEVFASFSEKNASSSSPRIGPMPVFSGVSILPSHQHP